MSRDDTHAARHVTTRRQFWRGGGGWMAGWWFGDFWLTICGGDHMLALDFGRWRIRWTAGPRPGFRPLYSEASGYRKWHRLGPLGVCRYQTRGTIT